MRRPPILGAVVFLAVLVALAFAVPAGAVPARDGKGLPRDPDKPNPLAYKALMKAEKQGNPVFHHRHRQKGGLGVADVATDRVLTILVEFAGDDVVDGRFTSGPLHNQLPKPAAGDNTNFWVPDFNPAHYQDMLFNKDPLAKSMYNYYLEQSGGVYAVDGQVYGWVQVPHSEAYYGANDENGNDRAPQQLIIDAVQAAGNSIPWADFDVEDPYDLDGDSNYAEPDGFVDHVQFVHAGADESAGGGAQGSDAIWAHSSWVFYPGGDPWGIGGAPTADPNVWVGPYTINPEDGTIGVFVHEFGHDLGLPDLYDTIYSGEASTGFWTLMSSGSWLGAPGQPLGTSPANLGIWEKWALGWADLAEVSAGDRQKSFTLKPAEAPGAANKGVRVKLPSYLVTTTLNTPHSGAGEWYSGKGDNLNNTLERTVTLTGSDTLTFWTWYDIEEGWDFGSVEVFDTGSNQWVTLPGNITTTADPYGQNPGNGITGSSDGWVQAVFSLAGYSGDTKIRFRYWTDVAVQGLGWTIDDITVTNGSGGVIFSDDVEGGPADWASSGWSIMSGTIYRWATHYYLAEWREPIGFDRSMMSWYNFVAGDTAEFFRANPGLLVWYRTTEFPNGENWVGEHPWRGFLLIVDSKPGWIPAKGVHDPVFLYYRSLVSHLPGLPARTRINLADATFGVGTTYGDRLKSYYGMRATIQLPKTQQTAVFDDRKEWVDRFWEPYFPVDIYGFLLNSINSVDTPTYGVSIRVLKRLPYYGGGRVVVNFSSPVF
ncbi:MAG: immune inhibitor A [Thermoleophilia bacterium]